jgi:hypothetical protein
MKTNTILTLLAGGLVVYLLMKKGSKDSNVPKCKDNEILKSSQPNCLVAPCPTLYSCELKKRI